MKVAHIMAFPGGTEPVNIQARTPSKHRQRTFEWMTSCMMLGMALVIAINTDAIKFGGFYLMSNVGLTAPVLGVLLTFIGCVRCVALVANGFWPVWGPRMRASCAFLGASIWAQMLFALVTWSAERDFLSVNVPIFVMLTVGELISCYRAALDVRRILHS